MLHSEQTKLFFLAFVINQFSITKHEENQKVLWKEYSHSIRALVLSRVDFCNLSFFAAVLNGTEYYKTVQLVWYVERTPNHSVNFNGYRFTEVQLDQSC